MGLTVRPARAFAGLAALDRARQLVAALSSIVLVKAVPKLVHANRHAHAGFGSLREFT
jgi:hypothetical protein